MSRILIATVPITGHVTPGLSIARALVARGHEVFWYTGRKHRAAVEQVGAHFLPMLARCDFDDANLNAAIEGRAGLSGLAQLKLDLLQLFVAPIPDQVAELERLTREYRFDGLLNDVGFVGMNLFAERSGVRFATYGVSALAIPSRDMAPFGLGLAPSQGLLGRCRNWLLRALVDRVLLRAVNTRYASVRRNLGLAPSPSGSFLGDAISPHAYLQPTVPGFEYPCSDLPPQLEFIGPFSPLAPTHFNPPDWWSDLETFKPVIHVTQGTVATHSSELLVPTLQALADEDVLVIATTGGKSLESLGLARLPANARVAPFIPYAKLLPRVDVMITNGGYGGVQAALAHGIPLVVAGGTEDKPEIARRVAWSGVGIDLRTGTPTAREVRAAAQTLLNDSRYRQRARCLQKEISAYDAPRRAAEVIERLISG